jgi:hypothetical protein
MDNNNFVLSVPNPLQQAADNGEDGPDLDANPHAAHQEIFDKLREVVGLSGVPSTSTSGSESDSLAGLVVHDAFQQMPNPTQQVGLPAHAMLLSREHLVVSVPCFLISSVAAWLAWLDSVPVCAQEDDNPSTSDPQSSSDAWAQAAKEVGTPSLRT